MMELVVRNAAILVLSRAIRIIFESLMSLKILSVLDRFDVEEGET